VSPAHSGRSWRRRRWPLVRGNPHRGIRLILDGQQPGEQVQGLGRPVDKLNLVGDEEGSGAVQTLARAGWLCSDQGRELELDSTGKKREEEEARCLAAARPEVAGGGRRRAAEAQAARAPAASRVRAREERGRAWSGSIRPAAQFGRFDWFGQGPICELFLSRDLFVKWQYLFK
jgi:hypothetical protein